jgi:hypothetical protein
MRKWDASFEYMAAGMDDETRRQKVKCIYQRQISFSDPHYAKYEFPPEIERQPDGPRPTEVSVDRCGGRHFFVLNHPTGIHENQVWSPSASCYPESVGSFFMTADKLILV